MYAYVSFIVDVKKHHRCVPKDNDKVGVALSGTIASHKDIDTSCRYDNDPR
jgi:hypothetical protein